MSTMKSFTLSGDMASVVEDARNFHLGVVIKQSIDLDFHDYPVHFLARRMVPAVTEWYRFRDWLRRRD